LGVFSGPGVGKSTLIATIARNSKADVKVIAMIGERGREVREFLDNALGEEGLKQSVVFVATGDESPLMRVRAAMAACAAAELYRDQGLDVVLLMDSVTRFCQAQRQIGLTAGEPPTTRGYTPSVFASLPGLLERAGRITGSGSITGIYAILVEGDDLTEPISDAVRGILDGHLVLSRRLANLGHYPAIDVLDSVSRTASAVSSKNHTQARQLLARLLARYSEIEEVISVGAYVRGADSENDIAVDYKPRIDDFLRQSPSDHTDFDQTVKQLIAIAVEAGHALAARARQPGTQGAQT
jgi:flagellum-specific ATP synthase